MLERAHITQGNRHAYRILIDNGLNYSEWGAQSISIGGLVENNKETLMYEVRKRVI